VNRDRRTDRLAVLGCTLAPAAVTGLMIAAWPAR